MIVEVWIEAAVPGKTEAYADTRSERTIPDGFDPTILYEAVVAAEQAFWAVVTGTEGKP